MVHVFAEIQQNGIIMGCVQIAMHHVDLASQELQIAVLHV
jgi:hypothetical protein